MSSKNTVLIVGGAGYIGSHTTLAFNEAGFETVVYDNFSAGHRDVCFGTHLVEGDLADGAKLEDTMTRYGVDCVVHFAAIIEAGESVITPLRFFQNNVAGTMTLLEAMKNVGVKNLVFSCTAAAYGNKTDIPLLHERLPRAPINLGTSVREVIDAVKRISGVDFEVIEIPRRPGDPATLVADASVAHDVLDWRAQHSGIEEIVRDA